jgi:hypothetical protein
MRRIALLDATKGLKRLPIRRMNKGSAFAFGNTHFENERISKETVTQAAESLKGNDEKDGLQRDSKPAPHQLFPNPGGFGFLFSFMARLALSRC